LVSLVNSVKCGAGKRQDNIDGNENKFLATVSNFLKSNHSVFRTKDPSNHLLPRESSPFVSAFAG